MPSIFKHFPSKYIKSQDLLDDNEQPMDATLVIQNLTFEKMEDGKTGEEKPVINFVNHPQGLVLNKTNAQTIADLYGENYDQWQGQAITLYPTKEDCWGERKWCLRIRPYAPQQPPQQPMPQAPQQPPMQQPQQQWPSPQGMNGVQPGGQQFPQQQPPQQQPMQQPQQAWPRTDPQQWYQPGK